MRGFMISKERKDVLKDVAIGLSVNAGMPIEKQIGTIRDQVDRILDVLKLDQTEDYKSLSELVAREKEKKKTDVVKKKV